MQVKKSWWVRAVYIEQTTFRKRFEGLKADRNHVVHLPSCSTLVQTVASDFGHSAASVYVHRLV